MRSDRWTRPRSNSLSSREASSDLLAGPAMNVFDVEVITGCLPSTELELHKLHLVGDEVTNQSGTLV